MAWEDFESGSTGGGFVAYFKRVADVQICVTRSLGEEALPGPDDRVDVGFFNAETGEQLARDNGVLQSFVCGESLTVKEALAFIEKTLPDLAPLSVVNPRRPYVGYGRLNPLLNELEELKQSANLRANNLKSDDLTRAKAQASADAYAYCQLRLTTSYNELG